jgi:hypothetical protein
MLSPDHKWVWDGTEWQPVTDPSNPAHRAVFAAWTSLAAPSPTPEAGMAVPGPRAVRSPAPAPTHPRLGSADPSPLPLWQRRSTGLNRYLYIGTAAVVLLMGVILLNAMGPITLTLPWSPPAIAPQQARPAAKVLAPLSARSDYGRADRFLKGVLAPAMVTMNGTLAPVRQYCDGNLTLTCGNTMSPATRQVKLVLALFGSETIPACIAPAASKVKADLGSIDASLQAMKRAFDANQSRTFIVYAVAIRNSAAPVQSDLAAATRAEIASCDRTVTGP